MKNPHAIDGRLIDKQRILEALRDTEKFSPSKNEKEWISLLEKLPPQLKEALFKELIMGNSISSIQSGDWPQEGSVVICLTSHILNDFSKNSDAVKYRLFNDPHYWYDELSQTENGVEHLIIT
jgi:hypothetical protein